MPAAAATAASQADPAPPQGPSTGQLRVAHQQQHQKQRGRHHALHPGMQAKAQTRRQKRVFLQQQWQQHGTAALAVVAALGWGLWFFEWQQAHNRKRQQQLVGQRGSSSPAKR